MTTAIILAGGLGTRLRNVVADVPKPMAPINGRPFLELQMDFWINQGVKRFILSVSYKREIIIEHFKHSYRGIPIDYAVEDSPLGTGGALLLACRQLTEHCLVLNGDTFFDVNLKQLIALQQATDADWIFSLFKTQDRKRYMGLEVSSTGKILALRSENNSPEQLANGGIYLINPKAIRSLALPDNQAISLENGILPRLFERGSPIYGQVFDGSFIDIGVPEDYLRATEVIKTPII